MEGSSPASLSLLRRSRKRINASSRIAEREPIKSSSISVAWQERPGERSCSSSSVTATAAQAGPSPAERRRGRVARRAEQEKLRIMRGLAHVMGERITREFDADVLRDPFDDLDHPVALRVGACRIPQGVGKDEAREQQRRGGGDSCK